MQFVINFFDHPFFSVVSGVLTIVALLGFIPTAYLVAKGVFPVWYRLGKGLSGREIAIFAEDEFHDLKSMLVDSKLFKAKNVHRISKESIDKARNITLLLVHYKSFEDCIDKIFKVKNDSDALIIYAPPKDERIKQEVLNEINSRRNSIIVNLRGRLLNDILISMITTGYEKN